MPKPVFLSRSVAAFPHLDPPPALLAPPLLLRVGRVLAACLALGALTAGCADRDRAPYYDGADDAADTGTLALSLILSSQAVLEQIEVEITGAPIANVITRTIDVAPEAATISAKFGGLPEGDYSISLSGVSTDGDTTCTGGADFSIVPGETVGAVVPMTCKGTDDSGGIIIDVDLNVCPTLDFLFIAPLTAPVGSSLYVEAALFDPDGDPISYAWTATEGSFVSPNAASTMYRCDEPGLQTLTLTTNDGGDCQQTVQAQVACILTTFSSCAPGEYQTVAPSQFQDRECAPCSAGTYSTIQNAFSCVPWTTCEPGEFVDVPGSVTSDQSCDACPGGTFSDEDNAPECAPWSACAWGELELGPGTPTSDTVCGPGGEPFRQFGTSGADGVNAIATDIAGNVYVAGVTQGALGTTSFGNYDAFLRKYDWTGELAWTQQFGTSGADYAYGVAIAADGTVYVAGNTTGNLDRTSFGLTDAYLRRYDADGALLSSFQFGTSNHDYGYGVAVDAAGGAVVAGMTQGDLAVASFGGPDGYVRKYDASGNVVWTRQYGTSAFEYPAGVATDGAGNVYVAGATSGSLFATNLGSQDGYLRKYSPSGVDVWGLQFGTSGMEMVKGPAVDASGRIYVGGGTTGALEGASAGSQDAFVRAYGDGGSHLFTDQFGTTGFEQVSGLAAGGASGVYLAGTTTGSLDGASSGGADAFIRRYSTSGALVWADQYGTASADTAIAAALDGSADVFAGGSTDGALVGTSFGGTDAYVFKLP